MFGQNQGNSGFSFGANNNNANNTFGKPAGTASSSFGQTGSAFGGANQQQQNAPQSNSFGSTNTGASLFGNNNNNNANTSFGAKPSGGLFGASNSTTTGNTGTTGTGLFGSSANSGNTQSNGLFGGNAAKPSGLFGSSNTNTNSTTGTGLFGNNNNSTTTPTTNGTTGGLFGNNNASSTNGNASGGLFGNNANNTNGNASTSGGLFGNSSNNNNNTTGTTGGLFGNNNNNTNTNTTSGGLFGNNNNNTTTNTNTGGLFGSSNTGNTTGSGGLFGNSTNTNTGNTGGGLFGSSSTNSNTASTGGLFGNSNTNNTSTTTGGLFGNSNNTNANTGGGLFGSSGSSTNTGGLFGNSGTTNTGTGGLFGSTNTNTNTTGGLFGSTSNQSQPQPLIATINQAAYELPDVTPSVKLYTSLTTRPKELKQNSHAQEKQVAPPPQKLIKKHTLEPEPPKPEARKLMNSYKRFLEERPTNLQIKRSKLIVNPMRPLALPKPEEKPKSLSIFHKVDKDVTTLTINKKALEQGYFVRPSLDDLLAYTKTQLKQVKGLIIGRSGFGQIEYPEEVDLSTIENLGDLLGNLVQFSEGTVCVYPDEDKKAKEGTELNKPAVVTIENVAPRDVDGNIITDNSDPRVGKFVDELKKRCKQKGAEFITFTKGIWVFKVPHFSVWGITPEEMIMDDDTPEKILDDDSMNIEVSSNNHQSTSSPSSPDDFVSAVEPEIKNQILPLTLPPQEPLPVVVDVDMDANSWADLLKDNVLLGAASAPEKATSEAVRSAVFAGSTKGVKPKRLEAPKPTGGPKFTDSDLLIPLQDLKDRTTVTERTNGLAKLSTKISFRDLEAIESPNSAWSIAAMVFEPSKEVKESLGEWIKHSLGTSPTNLGGLDLVWYLVTTHSLAEAAARATALGNIRLSTMISCLGSNRENARQLLASLAKKGTIYDISNVERKILEVASGNLGVSPAQSNGSQQISELDILEGLDWKQRIGMYLWYGDNNTQISTLIKKAVKGAPEDNTELAMLKLIGNSNNLSALLALVDEPTAFLLLQALPPHTELGDELYKQFSKSLLASDRISWAIFVALHAEDDELAMSLCREILEQHPTHSDAYLPSSLVNEAAAQHALSQGDYRTAATSFLDAGLIERAHELIVEHVAPQAVVSEKLESVAPLLDRVDNSVSGWSTGGKVYHDFFKFRKSPNAALAQSLAQSLGLMELSSLIIKAAVGTMSDYLAQHGGEYLTTKEVMGMPLTGDYVNVEATLRAYHDLASL